MPPIFNGICTIVCFYHIGFVTDYKTILKLYHEILLFNIILLNDAGEIDVDELEYVWICSERNFVYGRGTKLIKAMN